MPLITTRKEPRIEQAVPGAPSGGGSALNANSRGLQQIGGQVQDLATDLGVRRQKAEAEDYGFQSAMQDQRDLQEEATQAALDAPENGEGISDRINRFAEQRFNERQRAAPTELARQNYIRRMQPMFEESNLRAESIERKKTAEAYVSAGEKQSHLAGEQLLKSPDAQQALNYNDQLDTYYDDGVGNTHNQESVNALKDKKLHDLGDTLLRGYFINERYQEGLALLWDIDKKSGKLSFEEVDEVELDESESEITTDAERGSGKVKVKSQPNRSVQSLDMSDKSRILGGLSNEERAAWILKFKRATKARSRMSTFALNQRIKDHVHSATVNGIVPPDRSFESLAGDVVTSGIEDARKAYALDNLANARARGEEIQELRTLPRSQRASKSALGDQLAVANQNRIGKLYPGLKAPKEGSFNSSTRQKYKDLVSAHASAINKEQDADESLYVQKHMGVGRGALDDLLSGRTAAADEKFNQISSAQKYLEIDNRLLSEPQVQSIADEFNTRKATLLQGSKNPKALIDFMDQMSTSENYTKIMSELVESKQVDEQFHIMSLVSDRTTKTNIATGILNAPDYKEKLPQTVRNDISSATETAMEEVHKTIAGNNPLGSDTLFANAMNKVVMVDAQRRMVTGEEDEIGSAVDKSMESLMKNFHHIQSSDGRVLIARQRNDPPWKANAIETYMDIHKQEKNVAKFNVDVPLRLQDRGKDRGMTPKEIRDEWHENLSDFGFWKHTPDQKGLQLWYKDQSRGENVQVFRDGNVPIVVPFEDVLNDQQVLDAMRGGFQGVNFFKPRKPSDVDKIQQSRFR